MRITDLIFSTDERRAVECAFALGALCAHAAARSGATRDAVQMELALDFLWRCQTESGAAVGGFLVHMRGERQRVDFSGFVGEALVSCLRVCETGRQAHAGG